MTAFAWQSRTAFHVLSLYKTGLLIEDGRYNICSHNERGFDLCSVKNRCLVQESGLVIFHNGSSFFNTTPQKNGVVGELRAACIHNNSCSAHAQRRVCFQSCMLADGHTHV